MRHGRTKRELRAAVKRGIAVLDRAYPQWWKVIKLTKFNFADPCCCIVGTIGGVECRVANPQGLTNWSQGKRTLGLEYSNWSRLHVMANLGFDWEAMEEIPYLTELWKAAIRKAKGYCRTGQ